MNVSLICKGYNHKMQVKSLFIIAIVFSSFPLSASSLEGWKSVRQENQVHVWKLKNNPEVIGTFRSEVTSKPVDWTKIKSEKFFKNFVDEKRKILRLIGITNWKSRKYIWEKKKKHYKLVVDGTYLNSSAQTVKFIEHHLFFKNKTYQMLLINPSKKEIKKEVIHRFFSSVKAMMVLER